MLWWVDLGWLPGIHQGTLTTAPLDWGGGENKMEENPLTSRSRQRHFARTKEECKKILFCTSDQQVIPVHFPGSQASAHTALVPEGKHYK